MNDSFVILVRGIILLQDHILVTRCKGFGYTFLPGGHVEPGESNVEGLCRELMEELGARSVINDYCGVVAHQWSRDQHHQSEVNHLLAVSLIGVNTLQPIIARERHLRFSWVPIALLAQTDLRPFPVLAVIERYYARRRFSPIAQPEELLTGFDRLQV